MHPEITDAQQLAEDAEKWLLKVVEYRKQREAEE